MTISLVVCTSQCTFFIKISVVLIRLVSLQSMNTLCGKNLKAKQTLIVRRGEHEMYMGWRSQSPQLLELCFEKSGEYDGVILKRPVPARRGDDRTNNQYYQPPTSQ